MGGTSSESEPSSPEDESGAEDRVGWEAHPCLWVWLPLPEPLGLPEGYLFQQLRDDRLLLRGEAQTPLRYSVQVHQVTRSANVLLSDFADVVGRAARHVGVVEKQVDRGGKPEETDDLASELDLRITVLEVAVAADPGMGPSDADGAVDVAVEAARDLQSLVSAVTQLPVRLLSRATLPPLVAVVSGTLRPGAEPDYGVLTPHLVNRCAPPGQFGLAVEPLTDEQLAVMAQTSDEFGRGSLLAAYVDLRREVAVQLDHDGNARLAVVIAATAAEVFLDALALHMLWEEHTPPHDAATLFDRGVRHQARVAKHFPGRLGGNWDPNGASAVGAYFSRLTNLRNRVVHTGVEPTLQEAVEARRALIDLEHFCGDRLCSAGVLGRYPRTAMVFLGERGIRRRMAWTNRIQRLVRDESEPNWVDAFARYRALVDKFVRDDKRPSGSVPDDVTLFYDATEGRYVLHDIGTLEAAVVDDPSGMLTPQQFATVEALAAAVTESEPGDSPLRVSLGIEAGALGGDLDWRPEGEFFPELRMWPGTRTNPPSP